MRRDTCAATMRRHLALNTPLFGTEHAAVLENSLLQTHSTLRHIERMLAQRHQDEAVAATADTPTKPIADRRIALSDSAKQPDVEFVVETMELRGRFTIITRTAPHTLASLKAAHSRPGHAAIHAPCKAATLAVAAT